MGFESAAALLLIAFVISSAIAAVFRSDAKRLEKERDDALGRAVNAETAANKLFDRYSEAKQEMLEGKVPTVPRIHPSRPPPPLLPPRPLPRNVRFPAGCQCSSPTLIFQQPGDAHPTRCTRCGQYRAPDPKGAA